MDGQTPINIFTINNKRREEQEKKQQFNITGGSSTGPTVYPSSNTYTKKMEELDKQLEAEGLKIERLSDKEKLNYVNSLSSSEYERMLQYRDAGYSFGSAKALVDLERQRNQPNNVGGYRGVGFQLGEPVGGADSVWDRSNPIGKLTESIDNRVQDTLVPMITVTPREDREKALTEKYNSMTAEDWAKLREQYNKDPNAKHFIDDTEQENLEYYRKQQNMDIWDKLRGADIKVKEDVNGKRTAEGTNIPSLTEAFANAPASAIANASAVVRGATNPLDNINMLIQLFGTKEGRDMLAYRYLSEEGVKDSIEKDPVGWILDLFDLGALGLNLSSKGIRTLSTTQRLLGATNGAKKTSKRADNLSKASGSMENVADMGLSRGYDKLLDKVLGSLSQGGKMKNLVGDYISMTQRPLATIWNGANPKDEKGQQQYQTGQWTYEGVSKIANKVWEGMKDRIQTSATGLTPEVRERIRQNPYIKEYRERIEAMIEDEGAPMDNQKIMEMPIEEVGNELLRRLDEYESRLQEDGSEYQILDSITRPYNISDFMAKVYQVFEKNAIDVTEDGLSFRTTANPADMNPIVVAWNLIKAKEPFFSSMTIKEIREFRKQLRSLIKYHSDAPSTKFSKNILRQLIDGAYNGTVHNEIPELAKVDEIYSKEIDELTKFKDGLVYQQGEKKGQIKDNFYSIISTLNTQNRQKMKERIEKLFPDLGARVEAIRMLPILAKAYQSSPQMMRALFQRAGFLGGLKQSGGIKEAIMGWLVGIVADELFAKPMGEKWRKQAIDELIKEVSPEALQKLQEIKSKIDAGVELTEQEKRDLQTAIQDIMIKEYEYLDEKHKKAIDEMLAREKANQPKLPGTMDTIGPDGTIKLSAGKQVNNPENYKPTPRNRDERMQQVQEEYGVDTETAEQMTNTIEDFLDDVGANIQGEISPREVNYERFSEKTLMELMEDDTIPQSEKAKIQKVLETKPGKDIVKSETELDQEFAYRINKLQEEEQRVGKVGKNKVDRAVAKKQQEDLEKKREALKVEMRERYGGKDVNDQERAENKYAELSGKGIDYINNYKKSKGFREEQAEKKVLEQLKEQRAKEPKFVRNMNDDTARNRQEFLDNTEPKNGYKLETTDYNDRYVNEQTGDRGAIKFNNDGSIEVITNNLEGFLESGIMKALPDEAIIKVSGEEGRATAGELRDYEYQTVGRANPDEKDVTAEEGLGIMSFKGDKSIGDLADEYGLKKKIVKAIFTAEGEEALGRAKGDLIELIEEIKEGTAPHEVFHPIFNMVNKKRRQEIIKLVMDHKGISEKEAKERLADSFSEYFRTGKFDTKPIPKGFVNKVKWFFNQVREFINGTWRSRKKVQKLFDDIMENKIERGKIESNEWEYQKNADIVDRSMDLEGDLILTIGRTFNGWKMENLMKAYDPNIDKRQKNLNFGDGAKVYLEDIYRSLQSVINKNGRDAMERLVERLGFKHPEYEDILKAYDHPLKTSEYKGEFIQPIRDRLAKTGLDFTVMRNHYSPDTIQWMQNMGIGYDEDITIQDLKDVEKLIKNLSENRDENLKEKTIGGADIDKWMSRIKGTGVDQFDSSRKTFAERRIGQLSTELWDDILDPIADIVQSAYNGSVPEFNTMMLKINEAIGKTYSDNIKERRKALDEEIKKIFKEFGKEPKRYNIIPEAKLQNLQAKLKEFFAVPYDLPEYDNYSGNGFRNISMQKLITNAYQSHSGATPNATSDEGKVKQLVAISNMNIENFQKTMEDFGGKVPMPSIAVTDVNVPHTAFGELSLIFGRDTVDPEVDERNVLYASDAYTPTFPTDLKEVGGLDYNKLDKELDTMLRVLMDEGLDLTIEEADKVAKFLKNEFLNNYNRRDFYSQYYHYTEDFVDNLLSEYNELEDKLLAKGKGGYQNFTKMVEALNSIVENNIPETVIPGSYFKGKITYNTPQGIDNAVDRIYEKLPEKGKQKLIDDGYDPNDTTHIFDKYKDDPMKQGISSMLYDIVETIEDRPNRTTQEAGKELLFKLRDEYGFTDAEAIPIVEDLFGGLESVEVDAESFADDIIGWLPDKDEMQTNFQTMDGILLDVKDKLMEYADDIDANTDVDRMVNNIEDDLYYIYDDAIADYNQTRFDDGDLGSEDEITRESTRMMDGWSRNLDRTIKAIRDNIQARVDLLKKSKSRDRPLTPENILEAMRGQDINRRVKPGSLRSIVGVEGKKFSNIEQTRAKNLAKVTHDDWTGDLSDLNERYETIVKDIAKYQDKSVPLEDRRQKIRLDIENCYDPDIETFMDNLIEEDEFIREDVGIETIKEISDIIEMGKQVPVRFSESKPERLVDLEKEVKAILVPKDKIGEVDRIIKGTPLEGKTHIYDAGGYNQERSDKIKQIQKKYGDIFFSMGGVIMPIAMLYLMMQGEDDQGEGQEA